MSIVCEGCVRVGGGNLRFSGPNRKEVASGVRRLGQISSVGAVCRAEEGGFLFFQIWLKGGAVIGDG